MSDGQSQPSALLALAGDVMLGRLVSREIAHRPPESFWGDTLPVLREADAVIANLECAISERGEKWSRTYKVFHFRAEPGAIDVLNAARVSYVSLANNHVLDYGEEAFADTLEHLERAGIAHSGAGRNLAEARRPARFSAGGLTISAFSITDNEPVFSATATRPGTCFVAPGRASEYWPTPDAVAAERNAGADLVFVSAHLGPNMVLSPNKKLKRLKRQLIDAGCDFVHGHSAHVFQGLEAIGRKLILHDTGDFLDDYATDEILRNDWSFLFLMDVDRGGIRRLTLRPVALGFAEVNFASGGVFDAICERMVSLSRDFGTRLERCAEGLELVLDA